MDVSNPKDKDYKALLKKDPQAKKGGELYTCLAKEEAESLVAASETKDAKTTLTFSYEIKGGDKTGSLTSEQIAEITAKIEALEKATADTWLLLAGVIVFFMQTGFALLEAGSVRFKNYQNILLKNCMDACIGGGVWWACGYAFAFGDVNKGFIGKKYFFAGGDDMDFTNWYFQFAFACTAATIVSGSLAERVQINTYLLFSFFMTGFIYPVVVAWTWGGGWLTESGYQDFAGSGIVHLTGGVAGLVGAIIAGPRFGRFPDDDKKN